MGSGTERRSWTSSTALQLGGVLLVGLAARLAGWTRVFTDRGVRFAGDTDPLYHVMQAERFLARGLAGISFDPRINWPLGASVPWPPLFDVVLAGSARLLHGPSPSRAQLEQVAALVPVVLGVVTLGLVVGLAGALLGRARAAGPALLVAVLASHVAFSGVGRADQHVAEILLFCGICWAYVSTWTAPTRRGRAGAIVALSVGVALAFWNWMGSALDLIPLLAFAGVAHLLLDEEVARRLETGLWAGLAGAAALLALTVAAWGAPGALRSGGLLGITGLHVAVVAGGAAFAALLRASARLRRAPAGAGRRAAEVVAALVLPAAAALAGWPALRSGVRVGITALGAANPWYEDIGEFRPLLLSCHQPLTGDLALLLELYGLAVPAALLAVPSLARRWREPSERGRVLFLACWGVLFLGLGFARRRFAPYLTIPLALLAWEGLSAAAAAARDRWAPRSRRVAPLLTGLGAAAIVGPSLPHLLEPGGTPEERIEAVQWLGRQPATPGAEGVLGAWELGHLVVYYAGRPVVVTPFGTEGGRGAMRDAAAFDLAPDGETAEALLRARRVGFVALLDPVVGAHMDAALAGGARLRVERACSLAEGKVDSIGPEYLDLVAPRLYYFDGLSAPDRPAAPLDGFRLVYESPGGDEPLGRSRRLKIFQRVTGARLEVRGAATPSAVRAAIGLVTNQGRALTWSTAATADGRGVATLRLPYATGSDGAVLATPWEVTDGVGMARVLVSDEDVSLGRPVIVDLSSAAGGSGRPAR